MEREPTREEIGDLPPDQEGDGQGVLLDGELTHQEVVRGQHAGDTYVRVHQPYSHLFRRVGAGYFRATEETLHARSPWGRAWAGIKRVLIGSPLPNEREIHERLTKVKALAVFASDAMSSVAYATEEILLVLILAGSAALTHSISISLLIAVLLSMVAFSYRQTVMAYPTGGGSYVVARDNIGAGAGLVAASSLLLGYVLTVAVSISSGTAAITSAFPGLLPYTVPLALGFVGIVTLGNLRGIRESGTIFAIPTYAFILGMFALIAVGVGRLATGMGPAEPVVHVETLSTQTLSLWLLMRAFSAGAVAMSGTEAIADGVPAFKPPESKNAARTLTVMASLLALFFVSVSALASLFGISPREGDTVISQLGRAVFGTNTVYYYMQFVTMGILVIAANTAYADFPRVSSFLARDDYMPHQFLMRGDRLAFSAGIVALGALASGLILIFQGDTHLLIPLYGVGVFLSFTISQAGMFMRARRMREPGWKYRAAVSGSGAVLTGVVMLVAAATKFVDGAWIIIIAIPALVLVFMAIHRHYRHVDQALRLANGQAAPNRLKLFVLVVIPSVNYATQRALAFARSISKNVTAVTVAPDREHADRVRRQLRELNPDVNPVVLEDPYRAFYQPLLRYVEALHEKDPETFVTIVLPEFIVRHWWERFLHNRASRRLTELFQEHPNVAVVNVPYLIED